MKLKQLLAVAALLLVALWLLNRALHPRPLDTVVLPPYGLGQVLAEAAAKAAHYQGRFVVICQPDDSNQFHAQWEGFESGLKAYHGIRLVKIQNLSMSMGRISFQKFAEVVQENAQVDFIISFLPIATFTDEEIRSLPSPCPGVVLVGLNSTDVRRGMEAGIVKAAVLPRELDQLPGSDIKTARQWFDYYYELKTN